MLATGTYKVWATSPESEAPDPNSNPDGFLIVADNIGSRTRYWVPNSNSATFPFISDTSMEYWFRRSDKAEGINATISAASINTDIAPVTHSWDDWKIDIDDELAGAVLSAQSNSNQYETYSGVATQYSFPIELQMNVWLKLSPLGGTQQNEWLEQFMEEQVQKPWLPHFERLDIF